ncbi:aminoglycoside phosphotransferase family protein [Cryptosporangium minutisporangium]|uniref:Aminoglycoside phosphotransferase domain-containing protein n=1 Tax=Cryptosporangium minutisporangium TaxID=113569 RepID=A0ABP6SS35_9ACTN
MRPAADIPVDVDLVARLVARQHPDLAGPLEPVSSGWDNVLYRLGDELCVRLPHRRAAADLIENEVRWLPVLARQVPTPIPEPLRVGVPSADFPWHWIITRWIPGTPATALTSAERGGFAAALADFLVALHVPASPGAPRNRVRGVPLADRSAVVRERLAGMPDAEALRSRWDDLVATPPWNGPPLWLHGDLHPGNLITDPTGQLAAVIDFGDVTAGDPATDVAVAWLAFDPPARATFVRRLGAGVDADTWRRAEGWALNLGTALASHTDEPALAAVGRHALVQLLDDPS